MNASDAASAVAHVTGTRSLRNVAIVAHVDHGKTTLVDQLLKQSGAVAAHREVDERAMDSNDLEKERGITILAKCTSVAWGDVRINIVDTPGHADFAGEVERILSMVDGVVLLVDAAESVMPQTRFVLSKALGLGLKPIVVVNKIDRPDGRPEEVVGEVEDLFLTLEADDDQLDFPVLYASGRSGWAARGLDDPREDLTPLFETILERVPEPAPTRGEAPKKPFSMLATTLEADPFLGRILTGRVETGVLEMNAPIRSLSREGKEIERARATKILAFRGLERTPVDKARAGDIVAIAGLQKTNVADTIGALELADPIPSQPIDPPTIAITVSVNDSPLAGREGDKVQSRVILARLEAEAEGNVAVEIRPSPEGDAYEVAGRGELQLGVLIETMRREGFELQISRPRVLIKEEDGARLEPVEDVVIDVADDYTGVVIEKLSLRKCELQDMRPMGEGRTRITMRGPSRGLIGYHGEFLTDTRGTGVLNRTFAAYEDYRGAIEGRRAGVLISNGDGEAVPYALWNLEDRGHMMIGPGEKVYQGMIVGENAKSDDLDVNVLRAKQLTNIRAAGKDDAVKLTPPRRLTLEQAIAYIDDDELVEVTPKSIRLRKRALLPHERKKRAKEKA